MLRQRQRSPPGFSVQSRVLSLHRKAVMRVSSPIPGRSCHAPKTACLPRTPPRSSLPGLDCPQSSISVPGGNAFLTDDHNPFWTGSEALALSDVPGGSSEANMLPSPLPLPDTLSITPADEFTDIDSEDDEAAPERQENKKARPAAQANNSIVNILLEAPYVCSQSSTASL